MLDFSTTVQKRQSIRAFKDTPLSRAEIEAVLQDTFRAPSAVNAQPWQIHIVSGQTWQKLSAALVDVLTTGKPAPDFSYDQAAFTGEYENRMRHLYKTLYDGFGITREDKAGRARFAAANISGYGAPHAAFFFAPKITDNVFVAMDVGMLVQTFMLALTARGFGSVPQLALARYPDTVREILGVPSEMKLLLGVSFGYPDFDAKINQIHLPRADLSETTVFHD